MSEQTAGGAAVPTWTTGDYLRKAREHAGLSQQELADEIGISRRTLGSYESGASKVKKPVLLAWHLRTGVPLEWLMTGSVTSGNGDDGGRSSDNQPGSLMCTSAPDNSRVVGVSRRLTCVPDLPSAAPAALAPAAALDRKAA